MTSERESLERIHTFSLKESREQEEQKHGGRHRGISGLSQGSSNKSSRSYSQYLPEKV